MQIFTESTEILATYEALRLPARRLREILSQAEVSDEIINGCELAMQELLTNLVDHAYQNDATKKIKVSITLQPNSLIIKTEDTGVPADIKLEDVKMPDPTELTEGGYGMALIKMLVDEIKYKTENGTNIWQLIKYFQLTT